MRYGVTLKLVTTDTTMRIEQLERCGRQYSRDAIPPAIASRALWGIISYITTATHLWMLHGQCGALLADISERRLDRMHPLRCILLPTELSTNEVLTRAVSALLTSQGMPALCFPWTIDGLRALLCDYENWNPLDTDNARSQLLRSDHEYPVVGDLGRWWRYIQQHMREAVNALYATDASVQQDVSAAQWLHEASNLLGIVGSDDRHRVATILSLAFFAQIRHNFLSNDIFGHIIRWYYILHPGPTSVGQSFRSMLTTSITSLKWVPLVGRQFERICLHAGVRGVMTRFYAGLEPTEVFAHSTRHRLALPSEMECSTGI
jgi:hypothetical protein